MPPEPTAVASTATPRRRRIRPLRLLLGMVMSFALVLVLMLGLVLGTQTGLRFAVGLVEDLAPGVLSVERVEGRVTGQLTLDRLAIQVADFEMRADSIVLDWSPIAVLRGDLPIEVLRIQGLDLVLPPSPEESAPLVLPDLVLPLRIDLHEAQVERLRLFKSGEAEPFFVIEDTILSASLRGSELKLVRLEVMLPTPRLAARAFGRVELSGDYPLDLDLDWEMTQAPAIALQGSAKVTGDLASLQVRHRLSGSAQAALDVRLDDPLGKPAWDGQLEILGVNLPDFGSDLPGVTVTGLLETQGDLEKAVVKGHIDARAPQLPDFGNLAAVLDVAWAGKVLEIRSLALTEQVSEARLNATGRLDLNVDPGRFEVTGAWERLRWPLSGDLIAESPRGQLDASGDFDAFVYSLSLAASGPDVPPATLDLGGSGSQTAAQIDALKLSVLDGELLGKGEVTWSPDVRWTLTLDGTNLDPVGLVEGLEDRLSFQFETSGGLDGFEYDFAARSVGPGLPPSQLRLGGRGDVRQTRIETLVLDTLNGRIEGGATLGWDPQVTWEATLDASDIDPGSFAAEWGGNLAARLSSRGKIEPSGPDLVARIEQFEGLLRGYPVLASGTVAMTGETIRIDGLDAASGSSALNLQGQIDKTIDLVFSLESPDLASVLPEAAGSLTARGKISGPRESPRVLLDLAARDAEWSGQGIATLSGRLDLGLSTEDPFDIRLDGSRLVVGDMIWDTLTMRGAGRIPDHRLELALKGEPLSVILDAAGGLDSAGAYTGRIARLDVDAASFGDWTLQRPSPIAVAGPTLAFGPFCIRGPADSGGCVELKRDANERAVASLDVTLADFTLLAPVLPETLDLTGNARVRGQFETAGSVLKGTASAEIPQGSLRVMMGGGRDETLDFSGTRLAIDAGAKALSVRLGIPLEGFGRVDGTLDLAGWRLDDPGRKSQPLAGTLRADLQGLDRIGNLVPEIAGMTGGLGVDLGVRGTLGAPALRGEAQVRDVGFTVPLIGLRVADLNLTASAPTGERLDLQGQADIGGGRLELTGDARLGGGGFAAQARVFGTGLKVADTTEYFALLSPDLNFEANSKGARLSGEITIPEARIRPRAIPAGTQTQSSDVVLADSSEEAALPLTIDLRVKLGDAVTVDAFGLRGRLAGNLGVSQMPGRDMLGNGQLQIIDGQYRLTTGLGLSAEIGAPLNISQGRVIYARSPIDNPGLVIQAERDGGSTVAGIRVLGTLREPKLTFFSGTDPGMTQAQITKFLLTGIAPGGSGESDTGLAVGTYIAPKIFLEYETGLGDQANSVRHRYDLTDHVEIQTETGGNQGADIFYSFER
ncbi:translocation/assembly module TamB domain-containing protein [Thiocapsa bogorovii]|uniref:translocation/assembly module TamB domain-containing protein n=1 Tax=Thiocapsa bogorovii TaxID=521689 RepID=UPI001E41BFFF|nr:translocation/assembly module TamB domain-containing protein [Thiocapsa bogorovii]UHD17344.1 translocation/assembly module TamB domain-containing protein [Thiocapsa bogorovii]